MLINNLLSVSLSAHFEFPHLALSTFLPQCRLSPLSFCWLQWFIHISNSAAWPNINNVCVPQAASWSHLSTHPSVWLSFTSCWLQPDLTWPHWILYKGWMWCMWHLQCSWFTVIVILQTYCISLSCFVIKVRVWEVPLKYSEYSTVHEAEFNVLLHIKSVHYKALIERVVLWLSVWVLELYKVFLPAFKFMKWVK